MSTNFERCSNVWRVFVAMSFLLAVGDRALAVSKSDLTGKWGRSEVAVTWTTRMILELKDDNTFVLSRMTPDAPASVRAQSDGTQSGKWYLTAGDDSVLAVFKEKDRLVLEFHDIVKGSHGDTYQVRLRREEGKTYLDMVPPGEGFPSTKMLIYTREQ